MSYAQFHRLQSPKASPSHLVFPSPKTASKPSEVCSNDFAAITPAMVHSMSMGWAGSSLNSVGRVGILRKSNVYPKLHVQHFISSLVSSRLNPLYKERHRLALLQCQRAKSSTLGLTLIGTIFKCIALTRSGNNRIQHFICS